MLRHTTSREKDTSAETGYQVVLLSLEPQPISGRATRQADYVATFRVSRGASTAER